LTPSRSAKRGKAGGHSAGQEAPGTVAASRRDADGNYGRERQSEQSRLPRQGPGEEPTGELTGRRRIVARRRLAGVAGYRWIVV
jgi:hypothetical protein